MSFPAVLLSHHRRHTSENKKQHSEQFVPKYIGNKKITTKAKLGEIAVPKRSGDANPHSTTTAPVYQKFAMTAIRVRNNGQLEKHCLRELVPHEQSFIRKRRKWSMERPGRNDTESKLDGTKVGSGAGEGFLLENPVLDRNYRLKSHMVLCVCKSEEHFLVFDFFVKKKGNSFLLHFK